VLRRVKAGERLHITQRGRPVAELGPLDAPPTTIAWETFLLGSEDWRADTSLSLLDLFELAPVTTDEIPVR
jgi:antitoxin (DNA-binding transcriptional repressor) of toxin-antitoxin stability system